MLDTPSLESPTTFWLAVKLRAYLSLIKYMQTGLLVITGLAGYMSGQPTNLSWSIVSTLFGSLFLTVGGSTVVNMVIDRDIDGIMQRTSKRPLPTGVVKTKEGLILGSIMIGCGTAVALRISHPYTIVILAGVFFDVIIYTHWLKRRTPWAIVWGGIAGGMPILAGRTAATGSPDITGILLALAVLLWIPTHILTLSMKYADDYANAKVPVIPNHYGEKTTRLLIGLSTSGAILVMLGVAYMLDINPMALWIARGLGGMLFFFTLASIIHPTSKLNFIVYKLASLYMLGSMILLIAAA
jgi:protoheme IX farnesyltransferase